MSVAKDYLVHSFKHLSDMQMANASRLANAKPPKESKTMNGSKMLSPVKVQCKADIFLAFLKIIFDERSSCYD